MGHNPSDRLKAFAREVEKGNGLERHEQFKRDCAWIDGHWEGLLNGYPDKWIAVLRGEVIAYADSLGALLSSISDGDRDSRAIKFMDTNPRSQILTAV